MNYRRPVTDDRPGTWRGRFRGGGRHRLAEPAGGQTPDRPAAAGEDDFPTEPALIAEDIARTRRELGETLEALSARMDVRTRAREGVSHARSRAREGVAHAQQRAAAWLRPATTRLDGRAVVAGAAGVAVLLLVLVWQRRYRR